MAARHLAIAVVVATACSKQPSPSGTPITTVGSEVPDAPAPPKLSSSFAVPDFRNEFDCAPLCRTIAACMKGKDWGGWVDDPGECNKTCATNDWALFGCADHALGDCELIKQCLDP